MNPLQQYAQDPLNAEAAQRLAQQIIFGPFAFQASRLMVKFGILERLNRAKDGQTLADIAREAQISPYAAQVLLEASLSIGTVLLQNERYFISKAGCFLIQDKMSPINMDFVHDVCYQAMFHLEAALLEGRPAGLEEFGSWPTVYQGLAQLPPRVREKWLAFDHFYSDQSFPAALKIIFAQPVHRLLDVGGNTGRWALQCVAHSPSVQVTIMDLPQQLELMRAHTAGHPGANRIHGHPANLLDPAVPFPAGFDAIWMSQFLDCFTEEQATSILRRAAGSMSQKSTLYILEPLWDRQKYETAAYCLTHTSLYFTALANGNSKLFRSDDLVRCIEAAGLSITQIHDHLGLGHSLLCCQKA
ncbi:methyltransferase domain-containing protein [Eikenella sp. S3360]|uniref:Methyltransferase domain-containing protein n=1 Tax=Eikenella glucosivorans TaxID=2766967 RepID=A0ABS0NAY3_9NEIS|nr:class I SAM-dependent methyltransferase [Eikenella glucosivorans]MBH5329448.1 methyltransferase domain-containing protein [Eikenella glucosivorans]